MLAGHPGGQRIAAQAGEAGIFGHHSRDGHPQSGIVGSVADRALIDRVFADHAIEAVIHTGALHKPDIAALERALDVGFGIYLASAPTPFTPGQESVSPLNEISHALLFEPEVFIGEGTKAVSVPSEAVVVGGRGQQAESSVVY